MGIHTQAVEFVLVLAMSIALVIVVLDRFTSKNEITARTIQFLLMALSVPAVVILSLEKILPSIVVVFFFSLILGYILCRKS